MRPSEGHRSVWPSSTCSGKPLNIIMKRAPQWAGQGSIAPLRRSSGPWNGKVGRQTCALTVEDVWRVLRHINWLYPGSRRWDWRGAWEDCGSQCVWTQCGLATRTGDDVSTIQPVSYLHCARIPYLCMNSLVQDNRIKCTRQKQKRQTCIGR